MINSISLVVYFNFCDRKCYSLEDVFKYRQAHKYLLVERIYINWLQTPLILYKLIMNFSCLLTVVSISFSFSTLPSKSYIIILSKVIFSSYSLYVLDFFSPLCSFEDAFFILYSMTFKHEALSFILSRSIWK